MVVVVAGMPLNRLALSASAAAFGSLAAPLPLEVVEGGDETLLSIAGGARGAGGLVAIC